MTGSMIISMKEHETRGAFLSQASQDLLGAIKPLLEISRSDARGYCDLTTSHWVGSVLLPDGYLFVAPKVGGTNALRMMLEGDGELPGSWGDCLARIESDDLWDALAIALGRELTLIRMTGYQGSYVEEEDNRRSIRGRILPVQDMRFNSPVRFGVFSRDAIWSFDIPINQALKWASTVLGNLARTTISQPLLAEASLLTGIGEFPPTPDWLPEGGDRYRRAIFLTQLVRKAWSSKASLFGHLAPNAIVNMNTVFEAFVRMRLRRFLKPHNLFVLDKGTYRRRFSKNVLLDPDIVVVDTCGKVVTVGDVKYKWQWNFVNSDVYQMSAYLEGFSEANIAYVFFPGDSRACGEVIEQLPRGRFLALAPLSTVNMFDDQTWSNIALSIARGICSGEDAA